MNADDFADAPGRDGTRFGRGFNRSNIATHEDRDVAIAWSAITGNLTWPPAAGLGLH